MSKNGVSSKTHTRQQLNDYANQHNPNNKAYWANVENSGKMKPETTDCYTDSDYFDWYKDLSN